MSNIVKDKSFDFSIRRFFYKDCKTLQVFDKRKKRNLLLENKS
jgi:hypothetical protein